MASYFIDTTDALRCFLGEIHSLPNNPPSFYIDVEGHKLGRFGTLDLLQIHVLPLHETFIVDVFTLKNAAFDTSFQGNSLRGLLQSSSAPKVFFDARNDSDAMFSHYNITLDGVVDLQLMEYFQEGRMGRYLTGLKRCIERDSGLPSDDIRPWIQVKEEVARLYQDADQDHLPSQTRPLPETLLLYAAGDAEHLPTLYQTYRRTLTKQAWEKVKSESQKRLRQSRQPHYDPQGKQKGKGPYRLPSYRETLEITSNGPGKATASLEPPRFKRQKDPKASIPQQRSNNQGRKAKPAMRTMEINSRDSTIAGLHISSLAISLSGSSIQAHEVSEIDVY
jgi:exonuclease 3'-5' domain-containing protein 1